MKIERQDPQWAPITVTIETREEAELLYRIILKATFERSDLDDHPAYRAVASATRPGSLYSVIGLNL